MRTPTIAIHTFTATGPDVASAARDATDQANTWLSTHQWLAASGRSGYTVVPHSSSFNGATYTYILHLIGPDEETP